MMVHCRTAYDKSTLRKDKYIPCVTIVSLAVVIHDSYYVVSTSCQAQLQTVAG